MWGTAVVARRGPRCLTPFAFPLRTPSSGLGPRLGHTLGGGRGQGCGQPPVHLWTTGGGGGSAWGDRCGAARRREARERLTSHNAVHRVWRENIRAAARQPEGGAAWPSETQRRRTG